MMIALIGFNANAAMYLVGNAPLGQGWDPSKGVEMTDNGDGTYTFVTNISGAVWFVFADGLDSSWDVFNGTYRFGPTNYSDQEVSAEAWTTTQRQGNGSGSYKFTGSGEEYTIIFDKNESKFIIKGYVAPITYDSFTVAGNSTALFGTTWDPTNTANDMTLVGGLYTFNKSNVELTAGNLEFKVVADHDSNYGAAWPANNFIQAVEKHGLYDVEITFNEDTKDIECNLDLLQEIVDPIVEDCYTVAGTTNLFGSYWNAADSANLMVKGENGIYTWTKNDVVFEDVDTIEFKVVKNLDWANGSWPQDNWWHRIAEAGTYDFVITFDPNAEDANKITFSANKQGGEEPPVETVYTVAGTENLFGSNWNPADTTNIMVLDAETGLYTWTKNNVVFEDVDTIEFKVVKNLNWDNGSWPENNWWYRVAEAGTYDFVITFNETTKDVNLTATKQGGEEPPVETVYTVAGTENLFGSNWNPADTTNIMVLDAETGLYTWTKNNVVFEDVDTIEFKVVKNLNWDNGSWPENNWWYRVAEAGTYDFVITFNETTKDVNLTANKQGGEEPPVETVYTVAGPAAVFGTDWDATNTANDMTLDAESGLYTWTKENVELTTAGFSFKVLADHSWDQSWPDEAFANYDVAVEEAGIYTINITFNADSTKAINCTITKTGDIEPVHYDGDVYILGEVNDNGGWFPNVGVQMTRDAENNVYTATITTAGENDGYSYFSFTKLLAENSWENGGWDEIAGSRFGATANDFEITEALLGQELELVNVANAFKIGVGKWNLTLSVDEMTLVVEAAPTALRGDVDGNNEVDINDVTRLIDVVLGKNVEYNAEAADCNTESGDGDIDINDVTALIDRVLNNSWAN